METDAMKCINLVRDYMGIDLKGAALDLIDEPERPLTLSTVAEWVISTTERRYEFLCNLDSVIRYVEMVNWSLEEEEKMEEDEVVGQLSSMDAAEDAKRKARNRKKAKAKKASKQKKKSLGERQAEGDNEGESQDIFGPNQLAKPTE